MSDETLLREDLDTLLARHKTRKSERLQARDANWQKAQPALQRVLSYLKILHVALQEREIPYYNVSYNNEANGPYYVHLGSVTITISNGSTADATWIRVDISLDLEVCKTRMFVPEDMGTTYSQCPIVRIVFECLQQELDKDLP